MKINLEIEEKLKSIQQNEVVGNRLSFINEKLSKLSIKERTYRQRTEEELADVKQLEELGLRSLFKKVLGNLDQALEKERKEYLAAVLKHKSIEEEVLILEYEKEILIKNYRPPSKIQEELDLLIKKKRFLLKSYDTSFTKELFRRESELGRYKLLKQKSNSILKQSVVAVNILDEIKAGLLEVKDWSPSGKGKYSSVIKKKYIDRARAKAVEAKVKLEEFGNMVRKLFSEINLEFKMDSFLDFLDIFYDNLINDYVTRKSLEDTLLGFDKILGDVSSIIEIINGDINNYNEIIFEKEKSLKGYTRDYKNKAGA